MRARPSRTSSTSTPVWGPALGDVRHSFIGSVIYETPGAEWSSPIARHLLGGWQIAGIFRARTGEPIIVTQASSKGRQPSGCHRRRERDQQGLLRHPQRQHAVPEHGGLPVGADQRGVAPDDQGRQRGRWPVSRSGIKNLDVSLSKSFNIGGPRRIEVRTDILNALNWINYVAVQTNITRLQLRQDHRHRRRSRGAGAGPVQLLTRAFRATRPVLGSRAGRFALCDMLRHLARWCRSYTPNLGGFVVARTQKPECDDNRSIEASTSRS